MNSIRVELLQRSLRAHEFAWCGLIPVIGLPFVVAAWVNAMICLRIQRQHPNPARRYVYSALVLSIAGGSLSLIIGIAVVVRLITQLS